MRNGECPAAFTITHYALERVECQMHNAKCSRSFLCIDSKCIPSVSLLLDLPDMPLFGAARVAHSGSNVTLICTRGSTSAQNATGGPPRTCQDSKYLVQYSSTPYLTIWESHSISPPMLPAGRIAFRTPPAAASQRLAACRRCTCRVPACLSTMTSCSPSADLLNSVLGLTNHTELV